MARPEKPDLSRNAKTDVDLVPPDNQPGHHPAREQDKPDLDAFAAKLGADPKAPSATAARKPARPKVPTAKTTSPKSGPTKSSAQGPSGSASRPAPTPGQESPGAPSKIETTPSKRTAAAPAWPESAPAADDLGPLPDTVGISAPQPRSEREPLTVSLALLPLRETVKRLEQLEKRLTEKLMARGGRGPRGR